MADGYQGPQFGRDGLRVLSAMQRIYVRTYLFLLALHADADCDHTECDVLAAAFGFESWEEWAAEHKGSMLETDRERAEAIMAAMPRLAPRYCQGCSQPIR